MSVQIPWGVSLRAHDRLRSSCRGCTARHTPAMGDEGIASISFCYILSTHTFYTTFDIDIRILVPHHATKYPGLFASSSGAKDGLSGSSRFWRCRLAVDKKCYSCVWIFESDQLRNETPHFQQKPTTHTVHRLDSCTFLLNSCSLSSSLPGIRAYSPNMDKALTLDCALSCVRRCHLGQHGELTAIGWQGGSVFTPSSEFWYSS